LSLKTKIDGCQWFDLKTTGAVFSGLASKSVAMVFSDLASKPVATVFSGLASKPMVMVSPSLGLKSTVGFLIEPQNQGGGGFPGFGLQTGSYDLVICASNSPRWFLGLDLKTKWATIFWLRHKIDGRATVWDMCRDPTNCFTLKQVGLGFPSLTSRLVKARRRVVHVAPSRRLRRDQVKDG
jgi:hypothetical protein